MRPEVLFRFLPRSPGKHKQAKKQTSGAQGNFSANSQTFEYSESNKTQPAKSQKFQVKKFLKSNMTDPISECLD